MPAPEPAPFVAVDIGNSRLKFGLYDRLTEEPLPMPIRWRHFSPEAESFDSLAEWLRPYRAEEAAWWVASVNRPHATRLLDWLRSASKQPQVTLLASGDLPLEVRLDRPDMVGIDRLVGAVGANRLRAAGRPAIVVDLGTAITVDLVSSDGAFCGGAILPGIGMAARSLHTFTDLLPLLDMTALSEPPPAVGTSTVAAMTSGIYWGAVGGVRELITRMTAAGATPPQIFLTGGAAPAVATLLAPDAMYVPHLILGGIALAAQPGSQSNLGA